MRSMPSVWSRLLAAGSQLLNVVVFNGHQDESISARSYREGVIDGDQKWRKRKILIDKWWRKFGEDEHCLKSFKTDLKRAKELQKYQDRESGFFTPES